MSERVRVSIQDGVADVRLDRPDKMNALDGAMFEALTKTGLELAANPALRVVVLSGEGRAFCAGLDFNSFAGMAKAGAQEGEKAPAGPNLLDPSAQSPATRAQRAAWVWTELPVPVIAAIHGVAFGGGLQIALATDIRIVAPDARLSVLEVKWGLIPDMAITTTLRHVVPTDKIRELAYTGRIVDGAEAEALGLVTAIRDDPLQAATAVAREIATKSPDAIRSIKKLINESWDDDHDSALRREAQLQTAVMAGHNQKEAVLANMEKRAGKFIDPKV